MYNSLLLALFLCIHLLLITGVKNETSYYEDDPQFSIKHMKTLVYQSSLNQRIVVFGNGFINGMTFDFEPPMNASVVNTFVESNTRAVLTLKPHQKWKVGYIRVSSVSVDGNTYLISNGVVSVAVGIADPVVIPSESVYYESRANIISIKGNVGPLSKFRVSIGPVTISPYKLVVSVQSKVRVQLLEHDKDMKFLTATNDDERIPIQVISVDSGAGEVLFSAPVIVGYVVRDVVSSVCDDSCEFSMDLVCDDGSMISPEGNFPEDDDDSWHNMVIKSNAQAHPCARGTDCSDCGVDVAHLKKKLAHDNDIVGFNLVHITFICIVFVVLLCIVLHYRKSLNNNNNIARSETTILKSSYSV